MNTKSYTVSVIIPCKNERGTIEEAVRSCPSLGSATQLIFVEGNSQDGTREEIQRVIKQYPKKDISLIVQKKKGKAEAVRLGFNYAHGDILIILDGDLTVRPEELNAFYTALATHGGCANGDRFTYPQEKGAMPFINYYANKTFSLILSVLTWQELNDTLCGTKALFKKDFLMLEKKGLFFGRQFATQDPFGDFDILCASSRAGFTITNVPVHYKARTYGTTQVGKVYNGLILLKLCASYLWQRLMSLKKQQTRS